MIQEKSKIKSQRPTTGNDSSSLDFTATNRKVPEIGSVLDQIDKILSKSAQSKKQDSCGC